MSRLAVSVLADGGVRSDAGRLSVARFDRSLRDERHSANPGTTADLTAAAIFVLLLDGGWAALSPAARQAWQHLLSPKAKPEA